MRKFRDDEKRYFKIALIAFLTGACLILFDQLVLHFPGFHKGVVELRRIISPFIYGLIMAYLLSPVYNFTVRHFYGFFSKKVKPKNKRKIFGLARVIGSILSALILIGVVAGVALLIVPQFVSSLIGVAKDFPEKVTETTQYIQDMTGKLSNPHVQECVEKFIYNFENSVVTWAEEKFMPGLDTYISKISDGLILTLRTIMNMIIGMIVCIYMLNGKEKLKAQTRKMIIANCRKSISDEIFNFGYFVNRTFGGFINGKIIDSIIIGILCFLSMKLIGLPYTVLISTIIGVTNIIPFFGPFIGAIPCSIILALDSPIDALYFLCMVLVLQQIDGNIIGPAILGGTTGLASFWVMFAIIIGGGLFGFLGMVLGVPVFATIYYYTGRNVRRKLARKQFPEDTWSYQDFNQYNINGNEIKSDD